MALVPKSQYKGKVSGKRQATAAEKRTLGATTYASGVRRKSVPSNGPVQIVVTWEYYSKNKKKWVVSKTDTWYYQTLQAAADYISRYMKSKGAKPNNKQGKEYFISGNGYWKDGAFHRYDNPDWDNDLTLYSQWIMRGGKYMRRVTFEQYKEVSTDWKRDYHDPAPDPWTHTGTVKRGKTTMQVRTYLNENGAMDTSEARRKARSRAKAQLNREYERLQATPLSTIERQIANVEHMTERPTKGEKNMLHWLRKIKATNPTWLQYAANAQTLVDYCVKYLKRETITIQQADEYCEKTAKYI